MSSRTERAFRLRISLPICLAVTFAVFVLPHLGNASVFLDNPDCSLDRASNPQFNAVGQISSASAITLPDGSLKTDVATAFLVSPCYIFTSAHVLLGEEENYHHPGRDYTRRFSAGIDSHYAFAGSTAATPEVWGNEGEDWVLMRLKNCIGAREEFGWFNTEAWQESKTSFIGKVKFSSGRLQIGEIKKFSAEMNYSDVAEIRNQGGIWQGNAMKNGSNLFITIEQSGKVVELHPLHSLTDLNVALVAYSAIGAPGDLRVSVGKSWEQSIHERVLMSASSTHGTSGAPVFAVIDGFLQVIGINKGMEHVDLNSTGETYVQTYTPKFANVFFPIQEALRRHDVDLLLTRDRAAVAVNPNKVRTGSQLPDRPQSSSCRH